MDRWLPDLKHLVRGLAHRPTFVLVAAFTLAVGIGANTAVFSVLNGVILSPLPFANPDRLVRIYPSFDGRPNERGFLSVPDARDARSIERAFSSVGIFDSYAPTGADLATPGEPPRRIRTLAVNARYFETLGATPAVGRTFAADEERDSVTRVILSHRLWRDLAHLDPGVIGRTIRLDGQTYEVVGAMRESFVDLVGRDVDAWTPLDLTLGSHHRWNHYLGAVGRLAPGVTVAEARARLHTMTANLPAEYRRGAHFKDLYPAELLDDMVGSSRPTVWILMTAAALVLLIACLNVANLFLVRSLGRAPELALRAALGAHRGRLVAECLTESLIVTLGGGLVGSLGANWGVRALLALSPESLPRAEAVGTDLRLLGFALATTVLTGLVSGAMPAWRAARVDPTAAMREAGRGRTGSRRGRRIREAMVVAQIAVALVLLASVGTLLRAFVQLVHTDLGFSTDRVATFTVNLPDARYGAATRAQFHRAFTDRLRALPGVEKVGATSWLPANGDYHQWSFEYTDADGSSKNIDTQFRVVEGDYFAALGIPLLAGRLFDPIVKPDSLGVILVNRQLARQAYGTRNPIGDLIQVNDRRFQVIGVVGSAAQHVDGTVAPEAYFSHQEYADDRNWTLSYVMRTAPGVGKIEDRARAELAALDPELVLYRPGQLEAGVAAHRAREQFTMLLMAVFAGVALSLAGVGLYGVIAYDVSDRLNEFGIRMALGAAPAQVRRGILRQAARIAGIGVLVGIAGAVAAQRALGAITTTPETGLSMIGWAIVVLAAVALGAGYIPARRATEVDPLEALRSG